MREKVLTLIDIDRVKITLNEQKSRRRAGVGGEGGGGRGGRSRGVVKFRMQHEGIQPNLKVLINQSSLPSLN